MEIWRIINSFMDIYCYNMGIRRCFNVFTAFMMEILRILNGFKAFNGYMEDFNNFVDIYCFNMKIRRNFYRFYGFYHGNSVDFKRFYIF
jgi:hypothetical protein